MQEMRTVTNMNQREKTLIGRHLPAASLTSPRDASKSVLLFVNRTQRGLYFVILQMTRVGPVRYSQGSCTDICVIHGIFTATIYRGIS